MASFKAPSQFPPRRKKPDSKSGTETKASESTAVKSSDVEQSQSCKEVVKETEEEGTGTLVAGESASAGSATDKAEETPEETSSKPSPQYEKTSPGTGVENVASPPSLPYTEPHWSGVPSLRYFLTVIKSGSVVEEVDISNKPFQVFGRLPVCDVSLEHPSISRYHAVLQYRPTDAAVVATDGEEGRGNTLASGGPNEAGFYVYDLNSTHGSFLNKSKLQPRIYYRVRVGQMVRFGGSSRLFVLEVDSSEDQQEVVEAEAQAEIRELQREKDVWLKRQKEREEERERLAREREEMGATWGMVMDEVQRRENEEEELTLDPEREAYYKDDPKKALKKFFDREGLELDYEVEEEGSGRDKAYVVRVTLPIESGGGQLVVEESVRGKKKEAVFQCALKACRILDSNDMLRVASKRRQRLSKNWEENDYYDSDEDPFLDRTGELEQKRQQRMKRLGKLQEQAESYDTLNKRLEEVKQTKQSIEARLSKAQKFQEGGSGDSLDEYMSVVSHQLDPATIKQLKQQVQELSKEEDSIGKLLKIAKPTELPSIQTSVPREGIASVEHVDTSTTPTLTTPTSSSSSIPPHPPGDTTSSLPRARRRKKRSSSSGSCEDGRGVGEEASKKRPRVIGPTMPPQAKRDIPEQKKEALWEEDPEFASWLPPENQSGDGRTHLNDKYGY